MKDKILVFIYNEKENKFLLLSITKHPDHASQGGWFNITKDIKDIKHTKDIIRKEIKTRTRLIVKDIFSLNWGTTYKWKNEEFKEMNFIAFVTSKKIILNEKSSKYKWLHIDKFIKEIRWGDNTALLKNVLEKGIKKELYFDKKERGQ